MNIEIEGTTLREVFEKLGYDINYTAAAWDFIWNNQIPDEEEAEYDFDGICDYLKYAMVCYWPTKQEYGLDIYDFHQDFAKDTYTEEEFINNYKTDANIKRWMDVECNAYVMTDGSILMWE